MNADHWAKTIVRLHDLCPAFSSSIRTGADLSFDNVMRALSRSSLRMEAPQLPDKPSDSLILQTLLEAINVQPSGEVLVIPDCGDLNRPSFTCDAESLSLTIDNYSAAGTGWGLFDGCSDLLFVFSSGTVLLIDHDERCWLYDSGRTNPK